jgi:hypothetical protein
MIITTAMGRSIFRAIDLSLPSNELPGGFVRGDGAHRSHVDFLLLYADRGVAARLVSAYFHGTEDEVARITRSIATNGTVRRHVSSLNLLLMVDRMHTEFRFRRADDDVCERLNLLQMNPERWFER